MKKRIIPCLDVRLGRVVKGKKFKDIQDVADPVALATKYETDGADALFILDISGKDREHFLNIVRQINESLTIPLYVGGGIRSISDVEQVLEAGAQKASITSAAIERPELLKECADAFGDKIILSIDAKQVAKQTWHAFIQGGKKDSGRDVIEWAKFGEATGVSEILLNSIDADGVKEGFDLSLTKAVKEVVTIPVIASGGAGTMDHFKEVLTEGDADAALAASVFHYDEFLISDLKQFLREAGVDVKEERR